MISILIRYDNQGKEEVERIKKGLKNMHFDTTEPAQEEDTIREFWIKE